MHIKGPSAFWKYFLISALAVLCYTFIVRKQTLDKLNDPMPRVAFSLPVNQEPDWVAANMRGFFARTPSQLEEYAQRARKGDCDAFSQLFQYYGLGVLNNKKEKLWLRMAQGTVCEREARKFVTSDYYDTLTSDIATLSSQSQTSGGLK